MYFRYHVIRKYTFDVKESILLLMNVDTFT